MAKILLVNPVIREEDKPKHIPYGLSLLAAIAIENGHLVQVYDANAWRQGFGTLRDVYRADDWDVVGIGSLTTAYSFIKTAFALARQECPDAWLIAGGGFFTSMPSEMMAWIPEIDIGLVGEAFTSWPEALERIDRGEDDFSSMLGVCYRGPDGGARLTGTRPTVPNLDSLPWPAWDLLPLDIYFANSQELYSEENFTSRRRIDVNGSLGCSLICKFCWHLGTTGDMVIEPDASGKNDVRFTYGRTIRYHSPDYIVGMVKHLRDTYQVDFASFIDENLFTMDVSSGRTWLLELCAKWIEAGLQPSCRRDGVPHDHRCSGGVHWGGTSHASLHRPATLRAMYAAGCSHLVYGLESFDPGVLKNLGKGTTARTNFESVGVCLESGIAPLPNIIIGFPEESFASVRNTIVALRELDIHARPHFATPYPGSEWYYAYKDSIVAQYGGDLESFIADLGDASKPTAVISHRFSPMDLLGLQQIVARRDLRLLDLAEQHWNETRANAVPLATPQDSFHIVKKKVQAPVGEPALGI